MQGLPKPDVRRQAGELLESVKLTGAARQRTAAYSGGMRRRLRWGRTGRCAWLGSKFHCASALRGVGTHIPGPPACLRLTRLPLPCLHLCPARSVALALLGDPLVRAGVCVRGHGFVGCCTQAGVLLACGCLPALEPPTVLPMLPTLLFPFLPPILPF